MSSRSSQVVFFLTLGTYLLISIDSNYKKIILRLFDVALWE